jgi:hypothetical protein
MKLPDPILIHSPNRGAITIRPAVPEDAAPLRGLRLEALASNPEAFCLPGSAFIQYNLTNHTCLKL